MTIYRHHGWPRPRDWWAQRRRPGCWALAGLIVLGLVTLAAVVLG